MNQPKIPVLPLSHSVCISLCRKDALFVTSDALISWVECGMCHCRLRSWH